MIPKPTNDDLLKHYDMTIKELAKFYKVSTGTAHTWRRSLGIPYKRNAAYCAKLSAAVKKAYREGRLTPRENFRCPPEISRRNLILAHKKITGAHQFGRAERGLEDHFAAKKWKIKSPSGRLFQFKNLENFCVKHESMFNNVDDIGQYKTPLWKRAAIGIRMQVVNDTRKESRNQWRGWILVEYEPL
jgi:hypothetical protein